ncbi:MAG: type II toxin-antitoxin system VapC family toxin [Aphanocapsa sp. GSE-SYN-MK-11-07L]|jgi:tRNA(fMet)-specific endonuclease VapC|nr:type II toxin-antitoxin system VapC family toxin [Aphanocapsa sp. GSE-SYN-MK-11-07L]
MSRYILDTDHVSLFLRGQPEVVERVLQTPGLDLAITVVTAEEICQGWLAEINRHPAPSEASRLLLAYAEFQKALLFFRVVEVVNFDRAAYEQFEQLRSQFRRLDTRDLRIAAIALSTNAILVTRNQKDFAQLPDLSITDWSHPHS